MENSRILNWRHWSPIRKAQVVVTAFGFLLTAGLMVFDALQITLPRNSVSALVFDSGLLLERPSQSLARFLGIWETLPAAGFRVLTVSANSILAFAFGTVLGWLITMVRRARNRRNH